MKIVIIGGGLIGVTAAYFLNRSGHEVTVIDRAEGVGLETSFANGALLTPSMSEPWNAPGCWRTLLSSLGRSDAAMQLRLRALPSLVGWGLAFLRNSRPQSYQRNALSNLRLALYSLQRMQTLREQTGIEYGRLSAGALRVFRDQAALDLACWTAERQVPEGVSFRKLSSAQTAELEPALAPIAQELAGAIHYAADETGDAYRFTVALADYARSRGVQFCLGAEVRDLEMRGGRVVGVATERERFLADRYLIAAGSYSTQLLRQVGLDLPVRPAKGYSVTLDRDRAQPKLGIPILDDVFHAVVVPIGEKIRVAGTAEFAGFDRALDADRARNLLRLLKQVLPRAQLDPSSAKPWCGLRPMSVDGVPIIGATPVDNLLVSTGHGHLGWTMAAGSAQLLADLVSANAPGIDPAPYALARFSIR